MSTASPAESPSLNPATHPCAVHSERNATFTCSRCGAFACPECALRGTDRCAACEARRRQALGPFAPGAVIRDALKLPFATPAAFAIALAVQAAGAYFSQNSTDRQLVFAMYGVLLLTTAAAESLVLSGCLAVLRDERPTFGTTAARAVNRYLPFLGLSLARSLALGLGVACFIVPGLFLLVMWYVSKTASIDGASVGAAFERSQTLTKNHRISLFLASLPFFTFTVIHGTFAVLLRKYPDMIPATARDIYAIAGPVLGAANQLLLCALEARAYIHLRALGATPLDEVA